MLHFIPTPIGNTDDITLRGKQLLEELDVFFCEDTRTTKKLMRMYDIDYRNKQFYPVTSFTNEKRLLGYLEMLQEKDCGVVSEAGTPGLSDPGKELVRLCRKHEIQFTVLPGANALSPALVSACFDTSKFVYLGFLPTKKGRQTALKEIIAAEYPTFVFESVHRVEKTFSQLQKLGFTGKVLVAREISKMFEQLACGNFADIYEKIRSEEIPLKGEFVLGFYPIDDNE